MVYGTRHLLINVFNTNYWESIEDMYLSGIALWFQQLIKFNDCNSEM